MEQKVKPNNAEDTVFIDRSGVDQNKGAQAGATAPKPAGSKPQASSPTGAARTGEASNFTKKKKILTGVISGGLLGGGLLALLAFRAKDAANAPLTVGMPPTPATPGQPDHAAAGQQAVMSTTQPVSEKTFDDLSFDDAFKEAREELGNHGYFKWHGEIYNTMTKQEYDALQQDEKEALLQGHDAHAIHDNSDGLRMIMPVDEVFSIEQDIKTGEIVMVDNTGNQSVMPNYALDAYGQLVYVDPNTHDTTHVTASMFLEYVNGDPTNGGVILPGPDDDPNVVEFKVVENYIDADGDGLADTPVTGFDTDGDGIIDVQDDGDGILSLNDPSIHLHVDDATGAIVYDWMDDIVYRTDPATDPDPSSTAASDPVTTPVSNTPETEQPADGDKKVDINAIVDKMEESGGHGKFKMHTADGDEIKIKIHGGHHAGADDHSGAGGSHHSGGDAPADDGSGNDLIASNPELHQLPDDQHHFTGDPGLGTEPAIDDSHPVDDSSPDDGQAWL